MHLPDVTKAVTLLRGGMPRRDLERLVAAGSYRRLGGGWLAGPSASPEVVRALSHGSRLTCLSAAAVTGLWTPPFEGMHVYVRRGLDVPAGWVSHRPEPRTWPDLGPVAPLPLLLEHVVRCAGAEAAAIVIESAWNQDRMSSSDVAALLARLPHDARQSLARVRPDAQSGTETRVRWWLERIGVAVRPQVVVAGVGRVDLMLGSLVIECDSVRHHTGRDRYAADRRRDLELRRLGYTVVRLTWEQVFLHWPETRQALLEMLRRGDHRQKLSAARGRRRQAPGLTA